MTGNEKSDAAAQDQEDCESMVEATVDRQIQAHLAAKRTQRGQTQTQITAEIKLGRVQLAIERIVKENHISIKEWNLRTDRVENLLGRLLRQRDDLIKTIERD